jgi:drug/metabolite transporter (DMT)-like permease
VSAIGAIAILPAFATTREGIKVAWNRKVLTSDDTTDSLESWVWQFWIGLGGLIGGSTLTSVAIKRATTERTMFLVSLQMPLLVLGGVLGAKLTTSVAKPSAELIMFAGRLLQFSVDGLQADLLGKPRSKLAWVSSG